ncbi:MAG: sugar phosphate nucleotidyltransferase [Polyangiaceae bacterium]
MQVVILAGGLATRLRPLTHTTPKALIEVNGTPFLDLLLRRLREAGYDDVVLCIAHLGELIQNFVGDGSRWGLRVRYSNEGPTLRGTGGALRAALPLLDETFLVTYGDSYLPFDYTSPLRTLIDHADCDSVMSVFLNRGAFDASNVRVRRDDKGDPWVDVYEKKTKDPAFEYIDYGALALRRSTLENYDESAIWGLESLQNTLSLQGRIRAVIAETRFYEIGTPEGLADFQKYLEK